MKFVSPVYSMTSGSIAGLVYSHNRGGQYVRARTTPTNPNTTRQVSVRDAMRNGVIAWQSEGPTSQAAWATYALNTPMLDKLGQSRPLTGQQQYLRDYIAVTSVNALGATAVLALAAPTSYNLGTLTNPTFTASVATGLSITFSPTDDWAADDGALMIAVGRQQSPGRNFFKGPFRGISFVNGNTMTPPTSPKAIATALVPGGLALGNHIWIRVTGITGDGRVTTPVIVGPVTIAA